MPKSHSARLDSWKEIARYLGRDISTVMRWEKERRLPVHRVPGGRHHAVFAYTSEIDQWLSGNHAALEQQDLIVQKPVLQADVLPSLAQAQGLRISRIAIVGLLAAVAAVLLAAASLWWKTPRFSRLADVKLRENRFVALDGAGRMLWRYALPADSPEIQPDIQPRMVQIADVDDDGKKDVLVSVPVPDNPYEGYGGLVFERELYCLSGTGQLMWRFVPEETITFGSGDYGPPWFVAAFLRYRAAGQIRIALVTHHHTWWPSSLVVLDGWGKEVGRFVNSGAIYSPPSLLESPSGPLLPVGGVRNHEDEVSGMFAVLDGNHASGVSPEDPGSRFECKSCLPGKPLKYFVFPRSELCVLTDFPHNRVVSIYRTGEGIQVGTVEAPPNTNLNVKGIFEFTRDFRLRRANWSDGYRLLHRKLEREGRIDHAWEQCPDRFGPRVVRAWDPEHGWTELHPNASKK